MAGSSGLLAVLLSLGAAQESAPAGAAAPWVVGVTESPPLAYHAADGGWTGLAVDLWKSIAPGLGRAFEYREYPSIAALLEAVEAGDVDLGVGALTVTAERNRRVAFTDPFAAATLAIAARPAAGLGVLAVVKKIFTLRFFEALVALGAVLSVVGGILWLVERRKNAQFPRHLARGLGSGLWWSAVTMTTVGYGDKIPVTFLGRGIALVWMFASLLLITSFTGAIASSLTLDQLAPSVRGPGDLTRVAVGTLEGSVAEQYCQRRHLPVRAYATTREGLAALAGGQVDAFLDDSLALLHEVFEQHPGKLVVLPDRFEAGYYALALPAGSSELSKLDQVLLEQLESDAWRLVSAKYRQE